MKKFVGILLVLSLLVMCAPSFAAAAEITDVSLSTLTGGRIGVSVTSQNASGAYLLAAGYAEDGSLVSAAEVSDGSAVLSEDNVKSVKVFCWNNAESLTPLCAPYEAKYIPEGAAELQGVIVFTSSADPYSRADGDFVTMVITKSSDEAHYSVGEEYTFSSDGVFAAPLLGYSVSAVVREEEILSLSAANGMNRTVTVNTRDIDYLDLDFVSYYPSLTAKETTEAAIENTIFGIEYCNVILNGFSSDLYYECDIFADYDEIDEITFLDNDFDGSFEFVFVNFFTRSGAEFPVCSVEITDSDVYIEGFDRTGDFYADLNDGASTYTVIKDGKLSSFEDISACDVITVFDSEVDRITLYVSSASLDGTIEEIDGNVFTVSGSNFKISSCSEKYGSIVRDKLRTGNRGTFYLNYLGSIAYFEPLFTRKYVYVIDSCTFLSDFGASSELIKVVSAVGGVEVLTISPEKVDVYLDYDILSDVSAEEANDEIQQYLYREDYGFLAQIDTDEYGNVTEIRFPGSEDFTFEDKYISDADERMRSYSEEANRYGSVIFDDETILFDIDTSEGNLEDAVTVSRLKDVFKYECSYSFIAYGRDVSAKADAVVSLNAYQSSPEPEEPSSETDPPSEKDEGFDPEAPVMLVTTATLVTVDDRVTLRLTGLISGSSLSVNVDPDFFTDEMTNIKKGDIVIYSVNSSGLADNLHVLFDADTKTLCGVEGEIFVTPTENGVNIGFGKVTRRARNYFELDNNDELRFTEADEGCSYSVAQYLLSGSYTFKAGTSASVKESGAKTDYYVFYKTASDTSHTVTDVVVFIISN